VARYPHAAVAGLSCAAARCGVASLDRALGESGWYSVAAAAGATRNLLEPPPASNAAPQSPSRVVPVSALVSSSALGMLFLRSRLRPSPATAAAWAWLVVAEGEPALLTGATAPEVVRGVARLMLRSLAPSREEDHTERADTATTRLDDAMPNAPEIHHSADVLPDTPRKAPFAPSEEALPRGATGGHGTLKQPEADRSPPLADRHNPEVEATDQEPLGADVLDEARAELSTGWAGLLYLLTTASAAGFPEAFLGDPDLAERGVRWSVWQVGRLLTRAAADDPALLALAGLATGRAGVLIDAPVATPFERRRIAVVASRWRRVTVTRLRSASHGAEQLPSGHAALLDWLVRREGRIIAEPGWIDVVLPMSSVETAVRSAGLDLDPGFVPWLGTVVEFRYE
jgi:hypothetical protein